MNQAKVQSVVMPKRKPNLVRWFIKHNVSSNVCSQDYATLRAIEYLNLPQ